MSDSVAQTRARLSGLLRYVEQLQRRGSTPFIVPDDVCCLYEADLRGLAGVEIGPVREDDDETWLRVPRAARGDDPPPPPDPLSPWMEQSLDPDREPRLRDHVESREGGEAPALQLRQLNENPQIERLLRRYVDEKWLPWAAGERRRRKAYDDLFRLSQSPEGAGEEGDIELVWGIGVAVWQPAEGPLVRHPIITRPVEMRLDTTSLAIEVRPMRRSARLESALFVEIGINGVAALEKDWLRERDRINEQLSPLESETFGTILKAAAAYLDPKGICLSRSERGDGALPEPGERLVVTDTWVLFARRRSQDIVIADLQRLQDSLDCCAAVPAGPAALVSALSGHVSENPPVYFRGRSHSPCRIPLGAPVRDLYFPRPYNDEQVSIIEKLEGSPGMVVWGPPGTGKTHTIANVICHYLASGRRVLVTSRNEPALAVLRGLIPESVRALSVSLLTDEADDMRQFSDAIRTIERNLTELDPVSLDGKVASLIEKADELHGRLSDIDAAIELFASRHLEPLRVDECERRPEEWARSIAEGREAHAWFPDRIGARSAGHGIRDADIDALRTARRDLGVHLAYLDVHLPRVEDLPDEGIIVRCHADIVDARHIEQRVARHGDAFSFRQERTALLEDSKALLHAIGAALEIHEGFDADARAAVEALRSAHMKAVAALPTLEKLVADGRSVDMERQALARRPVTIPEDADQDALFSDAVERGSTGRAALGVFSRGRGDVKAMLDGIRVDGVPPQTPGDWSHVLAYIKLCRRERVLVIRWNAVAEGLGLPPVAPLPHNPSAVTARLSAVQAFSRLVERNDGIRALSEQVFRSSPPRDVCMDRATLDTMRQALLDHIAAAGLREARDVMNACRLRLSRTPGRVVKDMRRFLRQMLRGSELSAAEVRSRWSALLAELERITSLRPVLDEIRRCSLNVERAGAVQWAHALRTEPVTGGADPWTPGHWRETWRLHLAAAQLEEIDAKDELPRLQEERRRCEERLAGIYEELVQWKTWLAVKRKATPAVLGDLAAYASAVRQAGKETGPDASRHQKDARAAMSGCFDAVPCWIMPHERVSGSLPAEIGSFDLVIVDEASQSNVSALPCLLRGRKLLVVGDDQQVSPDTVGLSGERIQTLRHCFLTEQVHGNLMTPDKSLYDLAKTVFAGRTVMLREHFRSVAPIIEFSKQRFYGNELSPLRVPRASERLDPPLVDVFVPGGSRGGKAGKVNEAEARAIVAEVRALLADPRYEGRSMGIVSLLGDEQAERIHGLIDEHIPARQVRERNITVGNARTFQGKERDIMFLSMVATEGRHGGISDKIRQRFNVAASRARDRMYLFRSMGRGGLAADDPMRWLIEHFEPPAGPEPAVTRDPHCSDFEHDLLGELTRAGYRVQTKVSVGRHCIDLVVHGRKDLPLAIECDGDAREGPEQWSRNIGCQRVLERAGWVFWRCFADSFYRRRQEVLQDLFATLESLGIEPMRPGDPGPQWAYVERRVVPLRDPASVLADEGAPVMQGSPLREPVAAARNRRTVSTPSLSLARGPRIWGAAANGDVMTMDEGGGAWQRHETQALHGLASICFAADGVHGWAVGSAGTMIVTVDGGSIWVRHWSRTTNDLRAVHFAADCRRGWAVGALGVVIATQDGGETWKGLSVGGSHGLTCVHFAADAARGWAAGTEGTVIATQDAGETWIGQRTQTWKGLLSICFLPDCQCGWAVGNSGVVIATTNGGEVWTEQKSHTEADLHAVHFKDEDCGWAVGAHGTIILTTEGGEDWTPVESGTDATLKAIRFAEDGKHGWAVGEDGTVIASDDGGWTWSELIRPAGLRLNGVCFAGRH